MGAATSNKVRDRSLKANDFAANQLPRGAKGDKGDQGAEGAKGDKGDAGPTFGSVVAAFSQVTPSATPDGGPYVSHTVNLPTAGKLFTFGHLQLSVTCSAGSVKVGVYVDGVGVPGSGREYGSGTSNEIDFTGLSSSVAAGSHTITIQSDCVGGNFTGSGASSGAVGGVLIGA